MQTNTFQKKKVQKNDFFSNEKVFHQIFTFGKNYTDAISWLVLMFHQWGKQNGYQNISFNLILKYIKLECFPFVEMIILCTDNRKRNTLYRGSRFKKKCNFDIFN